MDPCTSLARATKLSRSLRLSFSNRRNREALEAFVQEAVQVLVRFSPPPQQFLIRFSRHSGLPAGPAETKEACGH